MSTAERRIRRFRRSSYTPARTEARVSVFQVDRADTSRQMVTEDEFGTSEILNKLVVAPPYNPKALYYIIERSNMVPQCIDAMVTNVAGYGWEIVPQVEGGEIDATERDILLSFIDAANSQESLTTVHSKLVRDRESLGWTFLEVIRDRMRRISIIRHAKGGDIRLAYKEEAPTAVKYDVVRGPRTQTVTEMRRFRKYVQQVGGQTVYFKEFGDPRRMSYKTGNYEGEQEQTVSTDTEATELIHVRLDSPDAYGVPRWINQLPSILGSREAEEVNLRYFEDNTIPPLMITVAGGRLTSQSFNELQRILQREGIGKDRQNRIMLIEAVPERESLDDKGSVQLKVDKLASERPSDGLFKDYDESNQAKIRSSFRLPPVIVGLSQDVTFATANVSAFIAEIQVFSPERRQYDEIYNKTIVTGSMGLGLKTCMLRSKAPQITNPEMLIKALTALNVMGAVTPRTAVEVANRVMQTNLPQYPEEGEEGYEEWMDQPMPITSKEAGAGARQAPGNTQDEQRGKSQGVKDIEDDGDVGPSSPENGQQ
jgi:PBSX family phage portal protein